MTATITDKAGQTHAIEIRCTLLRRLPAFTVAGIPACEVADLGHRVRSLAVVKGFEYPRVRVVVEITGLVRGLDINWSDLDEPVLAAIMAA